MRPVLSIFPCGQDICTCKQTRENFILGSFLENKISMNFNCDSEIVLRSGIQLIQLTFTSHTQSSSNS